MGICGRNIDSGTDAQKDRVIEGQKWAEDFINSDGCRCLIGHMEDWYKADDGDWGTRRDSLPAYVRYEISHRNKVGYTQFPDLIARFDQDRIIRACKMRAAKGNAELVEKIRNGIYKELREAACSI